MQLDSSCMTLEEKMAKFRASGGADSEILDNLSIAERKQLSSKFNYQMERSGMRSVVEASTASLGRGMKQRAHQEIVKSFVLHGGFTDTWMEHFKTLSFQKSFTEKERPMSMKELLNKYTQDEVDDLLETGGLVACKHSKDGRITMYIDKSDWEKTTATTQGRSLMTKQSKELNSDEAEEWDHMHSRLHIDSDSNKLMDNMAMKKTKEGEETGSALSLKIWGKKEKEEKTLEPADILKKIGAMVKNIQGKSLLLQTAEAKNKKNKHYSAGLKRTSSSLHKQMEEQSDLLSSMYSKQKVTVEDGEEVLMTTDKLLKQVAQHIALLKKL